MIGYLYIDDTKIGEVDFKVIDESMGAIGGELIPHSTYEVYRAKIQKLYINKGIANITDFHFKVVILDNLIHPAGGIGVTDSAEFDEIYVESAGVDSDILNMIKLKD